MFGSMSMNELYIGIRKNKKDIDCEDVTMRKTMNEKDIHQYSLKPFCKFLGVRDLEHCNFKDLWNKTKKDQHIVIPINNKNNINLSAESGCNVLVMDNFNSGKDAFLETFILKLSALYSPERINLYVIDSGQALFRLNYLKLPHIKEYHPFIHYDDKTKKEIIDFIEKEIEHRYEIFRDIGATDYNAYFEYCDKYDISNILPRIVFVIDAVNIFDDGDVFYKELPFKDFRKVGFNIIATLQLSNLKHFFVGKYDITEHVSFEKIKKSEFVKCNIEGKKSKYSCKIPIVKSTVSAIENKALNSLVSKMVEANNHSQYN